LWWSLSSRATISWLSTCLWWAAQSS
jgi:hypothetical protein